MPEQPTIFPLPVSYSSLFRLAHVTHIAPWTWAQSGCTRFHNRTYGALRAIWVGVRACATNRFLCALVLTVTQSGDGGLYGELLNFQQVTPGTTAVLNACSALNPAFHISVVNSSTPASTALPNSLSLAVPAGTTGTVGFANSEHFVRLDLARVLLLPFPIASRDENFGDLHDRIPVFHGAAVAATSEAFTSSAGWKQITFRMTLTSTPVSIANLFTIESTARPRSWLSGAVSLSNENDIITVFTGYSLDGDALPAGSLSLYIQDAINQIEFAIGDASTNEWGRPYYSRFRTYIATSATSGFVPALTPAPKAWYLHIYSNLIKEPPVNVGEHKKIENVPKTKFCGCARSLEESIVIQSLSLLTATDWRESVIDTCNSIASPNFELRSFALPLRNAEELFFFASGFQLCILQRNGLQFFQGEYATTTTNVGATLPYPFIDGSIAEAAYMIGFGRNSDIVFAASYAPFLNHVSSTQWVDTELDHLLMFSLYKGDTYLNSTTNSAASAVQWSATKNTTASLIYLKAINMSTTSNTVVFTLPFTILSTAGAGTILTAPSGTMNSPTNPNVAVPKGFIFTAGKTLTRHFRPSVLIVSAH
ncbi:alpha-L-arabinofuranosidase C-terminus-domain-containing protein [Mycena epipterygia]|nr:alpha-L-arabinofuranosidase C-terminus-domain-containing protein [Mycena epipterygia]